MVERNLDKVEVAGPSPVFRSTNKSDTVRFLTYFFVSVSELRDLNPPPRGRRPQPPGGNVKANAQLSCAAGPSPVFLSTKKSDPFRNLTFFVARLVYLMRIIIVRALGD